MERREREKEREREQERERMGERERECVRERGKKERVREIQKSNINQHTYKRHSVLTVNTTL